MTTPVGELHAHSGSRPDRSRVKAQPSDPVEELSPNAMDFHSIQMALAKNAYLVMSQGLDLQRWFEEQVSKRTKSAILQHGH